MRRAVQLPLLLLLASSLPAAAEPLGKLAKAVGTVRATSSSVTQELREKAAIEPGMEVSTAQRSVAKIALEGKSDRGTKICVGAVTLGPESHFQFGDTIPDAGGYSFQLAAGRIRLAFTPVLAEDEARALLGVLPHEVQIDTKNAHIQIHGSDVYVSFNPKTGVTRVYVREGSADVTAVRARVQSRATVHVAAGEMTEVPNDGRPPSLPRHVRPLPQVFPLTGDQVSLDPFIDLNSSLFDLPR
jgi:hypothetical protein